MTERVEDTEATEVRTLLGRGTGTDILESLRVMGGTGGKAGAEGTGVMTGGGQTGNKPGGG